MAGVKRKDGYTDLTDRLDKLNKEIKKKEGEFRQSGGQAIINGFTKEQKAAFEKMTDQEQAVYLARQNSTAGRQWGELAPKRNRRAALKKEIEEKRSKVSDNKKFKEASTQVTKRRKEFKDLEKEVEELKAAITLYSNSALCQQKGIKDRLASLEGTKSLLEMKEKELKTAAKNLGYAKGDLNRVVKETMSEDSRKAVKAREDTNKKGNTKTGTKKKTEVKKVPEDIEKIAKEKGLDVRTLKDSKGNSIYAFYDSKSPTMLQDGGYKGIITAKAAQAHSQYMEIGSDKRMKELLGDALKEEVKKGDFSNIIDDMNKRHELTEKVKFKVEDLDLSDIKPVPEPKPEKPKQQEPTIRLIPKTRRNGKPSKRNFEGIELTDVDGNKFVLTKEMMKEATKKGNLAMTKDQRGEYNWDTYVEAAKNTEWNKTHPDDKKGPELTPETVASFFKGNEQKPNMLTDEQKAEEAKAAEYAKMKKVISGRE